MFRTPSGARPVGLALAAGLAIVLLAAGFVLAEDSFLGGKLRTGESVTIPADETVAGDVYVLAGNATIDGGVQGDLTVFSGTVTVTGTVSGDLLTAGGTVTVSGPIEGDARVAGGTVTIGAPVGEDLVLAGGQASTSTAGTVGGDLILAGGSVSVAGDVAGSIEGSAGTYSRSGTVGGTENVVIDEGDGEPMVPARTAGDIILDALRHFVVVVLFGALLLWLAPRPLRAADELLRRRPLAALGGGLGAIVAYVVFVLVVLIAMIILGLAFGIAQLGAVVAMEVIAGILALLAGTFAFVVAVAYLADIVVGLSLGRLAMSGALPSRWHELGLLVAGAAIVVVITSLPVVGGLAKLAVVLLGLGAIAALAYFAWRGRRPPPAVEAPPPAPAATASQPPMATG